MIKFVKYCIVVLLLFLFLHSPIFVALGGGINAIKLLYPLCFGYFFIKLYKQQFYSRFLRENFKILFFLFLLCLYTLIRTVFGGNDDELLPSIAAIIEVFFIPMMLVLFLGESRINYDQFIKSLLILGAICSLISLMSFLNPSIRSLLNEKIQVVNTYLQEFDFRGFGLSESLTYSYGIIQAIVTYIGISNIKKNRWFIIFIPLCVFSVVINARTGIVVLIILLSYFIVKKFSFVYLILSLLVIGVMIKLFTLVVDTNNYLFEWVSEGFLEMGDFLTGTKKAQYSTADVLLKDMIVLPRDEMEWLFGRGYNIFITGNENSDSGYLIHLNYGGIIYFSFILGLLYSLFMIMKKYYDVLFCYCMLAVIILCYTKGVFIVNSGGFRLIILIVFYKSMEDYLLKNKYITG